MSVTGLIQVFDFIVLLPNFFALFIELQFQFFVGCLPLLLYPSHLLIIMSFPFLLLASLSTLRPSLQQIALLSQALNLSD